MTLISDASVRFSPEGAAQVDASLRISVGTFIYCHTYQAEPPILSVKDRHVSVTVTIPGFQPVSLQGIGESRYGADAGAAASFSLSNNFRLYAHYDAKFRAQYQSHQGTVGLELRW